ncbi:RNA polymerase II assembly factor RTP1 [Spathaspora sp. JA1]|nr:RNA polymerase II assembly factor RTP1 [Spathaspora sp. JA1]
MSKEVAKKNPFAPKTKTTIKRDAKEVYPNQGITKGLNKLNFIPTTPLDILFDKLEKLLDLPYEKLSVISLYSKLFPDGTDFGYEQRYRVIEHLLDCLLNIQTYSMESTQDKDLITISLHDIKTFSKLVNVIIIHGIYPCITPFNIGIPFNKRRLKQFTKETITIDKIPPNNCEQLLLLIYTKLYQVFSKPSDVTDLLTKGTGYSDFLTISITLITQFNHQEISSQFTQIEAITSTYELYSTYSLLLTTQGSPTTFNQFVMSHLQSLVYTRTNGVLSLIEFILGLRESEEDIQIEKFDHVTNIILQKPKQVNTRVYFTSIGQQSYDLLININRPIVTSCISYVIDKLYIKNRLIVHDFFLSHLYNAFNPTQTTTEAQLNNAINVLISLTKKSPPSLELYHEIIDPILVYVWGYLLFLGKSDKSREIVYELLTSYFTVVGGDGLDVIAKNIVTDGGANWKFNLGVNSMVEIVVRNPAFENTSKETKVNEFINDLDFAIECFIKLLQDLDDELISGLFISVLKRWLKSDETVLEDANPFVMLVDLRVLESVGTKFKHVLAKTPKEMLEIVATFLSRQSSSPTEDDQDSDDEEESDPETTSLLLQLLSAILTETTTFSQDQQSLLKQISTSLVKINTPQALALKTRITDLQSNTTPPLTQSESDKLVLTRAITALNDPLVPIRAHGLYLLRQLIQSHSSIITIDFVINLHLIQLKDPEPFIYLNVIKGLQALIELDQSEVVPKLCELYSGDGDIDERLRIGEILLRHVQQGGIIPESIVVTALHLIERKGDVVIDDRLRMSAMSVLGTCCRVNPLGMVGYLEQALDCALGILDLELDESKAIMRRSSVVLIHDLILGTSETDKLPFPEKYREKVVVKLKYISQSDSDLLVREQAISVLDYINELVKLAMELYEA